MNENDRTAQLEEIETLKAIYFSDEILVQENDGLFEVQIWASVELSDGIQVKYVASLDLIPCLLFVKHLPPIQLRMTLPENYPSSKPPVFTITCEWMQAEELSLLSNELNKIWNHNLESPIIYAWVEFLKTETLPSLGVTTELDLMPQTEKYLNRLARIRAKREKGENAPTQCGKDEQSEIVNCDDSGMSAGPSDITPLDKCCKRVPNRRDYKREAFKTQTRPIIQILEAYNREQEKTLFLKEFHECKICDTIKAGKDSMLFKSCGHIFCTSCVGTYYTVNIKEANLAAIKCPGYKCNTETTQAQVRAVVSTELFEKYDRLLLSTMLETLSNLVYCPRAFCQYPVFWEPEERVAVCPNCNYAFCIYCKMGYHGIEPCRMNADERRKLVEEYQSATSDVKTQMEARYGKKNLQTLKSEGCNKMTCLRCKAFFCWLCGAELDRLQPYIHFRDPKSPCNNKLFQFDEEEDEWEFADEWDADSGASDIEIADSSDSDY